MASPSLEPLLALGLPLLLARWGRVGGQGRYRSGALGLWAMKSYVPATLRGQEPRSGHVMPWETESIESELEG